MAGFYLFDKERFDYAINEFCCGRGELALIGEAQLAEGEPEAVVRALIAAGHASLFLMDGTPVYLIEGKS